MTHTLDLYLSEWGIVKYLKLRETKKAQKAKWANLSKISTRLSFDVRGDFNFLLSPQRGGERDEEEGISRRFRPRLTRTFPRQLRFSRWRFDADDFFVRHAFLPPSYLLYVWANTIGRQNRQFIDGKIIIYTYIYNFFNITATIFELIGKLCLQTVYNAIKIIFSEFNL